MPLKVATIGIFCSQPAMAGWLQNHLLPCPFKYLTGLDCPGCGFQRSVIALVQGNFYKSFLLYPAAVPLILFFMYGLADNRFKLDTARHTIKKTLFVLIGAVILFSYGIKMGRLYEHYKAPALVTQPLETPYQQRRGL